MEAAPQLDFEHLAAAYRDGVYRQMLRLCGNREDAEDVLTDALIAALRGFENLRERAAFGAWLAQIARRLFFHLRSQQKIQAALSLEQLDELGIAPPQPDQPSPEELLLRNELRRAVQRAVEILPEDLRQVYILRDLEELSGEATAEHLGNHPRGHEVPPPPGPQARPPAARCRLHLRRQSTKGSPLMKITIEHLGDVQFSIGTRGHVVYTDQPEDNHGYDEGMTPPELFLGALGACAAFYAVAYLKRAGLPHEGTRVEAHAEKLKNPSRLGELVLNVMTPAPLTEEHRRGVDHAVAKCILHNTLTHPPTIRTEITTAEPLLAMA